MSYSFTIDQYNEGVLDDGIPTSIKQNYLNNLDLVQYMERKDAELTEDNLPRFQQYIEDIYLKSFLVSRQEPKLLFAYYVQCDYQICNKNIKKAIEHNLQGIRIALEAIPKGYQGRLSSNNLNNQFFNMLAAQLINVAQMFIQRNTQIDFNDMVERVLEGQEVYDWYQKPTKQPKSLMALIKTTEQDFEAAIQAFIQAITPLSGLVLMDELIPDETLIVLHAIAGNIESAEQLNDAQPDHFRKMFQKSVLALIQEKYSEALYYFRKGMLMNRHFMSCLRMSETMNDEPFQFYEDEYNSSRVEALRYLGNSTGALWWKHGNKVFAEWASELSIVLEDRAALMREYERLQHLDDLTMPTTSIQDRVKIEQCELAVRKIRNLYDQLVYPWDRVIDEFVEWT